MERRSTQTLSTLATQQRPSHSCAQVSFSIPYQVGVRLTISSTCRTIQRLEHPDHPIRVRESNSFDSLFHPRHCPPSDTRTEAGRRRQQCRMCGGRSFQRQINRFKGNHICCRGCGWCSASNQWCCIFGVCFPRWSQRTRGANVGQSIVHHHGGMVPDRCYHWYGVCSVSTPVSVIYQPILLLDWSYCLGADAKLHQQPSSSYRRQRYSNYTRSSCKYHSAPYETSSTESSQQ